MLNVLRLRAVTLAIAGWAVAAWLMMTLAALPTDTQLPVAPTAAEPVAIDELPQVQPGFFVAASLRADAGRRPPAAPFDDHLARWPQDWHTAQLPVDRAHTIFEEGMAHYDAGRYREAYRLFKSLADCGHREAARLALQMRRYGPTLFAMPFDATDEQIATWQAALGRAHAAADRPCSSTGELHRPLSTAERTS
jgi:hypothetical protein